MEGSIRWIIEGSIKSLIGSIRQITKDSINQ